MALMEKIVVQDFRNIALAELSFSPNVNCISGNNGEGKTNLIDAVYYLSMTKSAFSPSDRYCFRHGTERFSLAGTYAMGGGLSSRFSLRVEAGGQKKLRRDDKPVDRISDHIGTLPVVLVCPSDGSLVSESGEERRRFLNAVLSQMDREYLSAMQQYNRLLAQRNAVLKADRADDGLLEVLDLRMDAVASRIYERRADFVKELEPVLARYYALLSGGQETVSVSYRSDLEKDSMASLLASSREKDKILRFTSCGLQRDDILFDMEGHPIRRCGSQGQQKSFLVSLKFAQYDIMKATCGIAPILLLDDVFDKLDMGRISNLLSLVAGEDFGQIFITDSNKVRLRDIVGGITGDSAFFEAVGGNYTPVEV